MITKNLLPKSGTFEIVNSGFDKNWIVDQSIVVSGHPVGSGTRNICEVNVSPTQLKFAEIG